MYIQNQDQDDDYDIIAKEVAKEHGATFGPPLKDYALRGMKMKKLRL
jgi:hypothetical protein